MTVYVAGTFNHLHDGHKALLQRAYDLSRSTQKRDVTIGIMSDQYLKGKYPRAKPEHLQSWVERRDAIQDAMGFHPGFECIMSDTYFPKYTSDRDVMVVSEESAPNAIQLVVENNSSIMLSVVPVVVDQDGYKISSCDNLAVEERFRTFAEEVWYCGSHLWDDCGLHGIQYKGKKYYLYEDKFEEKTDLCEEDGE